MKWSIKVGRWQFIVLNHVSRLTGEDPFGADQVTIFDELA